MKTCTSDIHPESPVVHTAEECPACRLACHETEGLRIMQDTLAAFMIAATNLRLHLYPPIDGEHPFGPTADPVVVVPVAVEPTYPPAAESKAVAADYEKLLERDTVTAIRVADDRFPNRGQDVMKWRGRDQSAHAYAVNLASAVAEMQAKTAPAPAPAPAPVVEVVAAVETQSSPARDEEAAIVDDCPF